MAEENQPQEEGLNKVDPFESKYKRTGYLNIGTELLFYISAGLSITLFLIDDNNKSIYNICMILFICFVVLHFIFSQFITFYQLPRTQLSRRLELLSNAFGIPLIHEQTKGYYNNKSSPSVIKLGLNIFESSHFTKNIYADKMLKERVLILIYIIIWLIALIYRKTDLTLFPILAQFIFSSEIISKYIKLEIHRTRNEKIFDKLYDLFLCIDNKNNTLFVEAKIINLFAEYEIAKATVGMLPSYSIYQKKNDKLSREWEEIKSKLSIS